MENPLRTLNEEEDIWTHLSTEKKKSIIDQLVQLHQKIPSASKIRNYLNNGNIT
jgi:hypothetical protein